MKLLTWNLHDKPEKPASFRTLVGVLAYMDSTAAFDDVVACVQEAPCSAGELRQHVETLSDKLSAVPVEAKAYLIYSRTLKLRFARPDKTRRAIVARFETQKGTLFDVVGLHFHDRDTVMPGEERGGAFALFRAHIDEMLDQCRPVVVLGDFNAEPESAEISSPYCFYARTNRGNLVKRHGRVTGTVRRPLIVKGPQREEQADGTHYWARRELWQTMDFVAVSPDLNELVRSTVRLTKVLDVGLLTSSKKGIPNKDNFSDHLPVLMDLDFR